MVKSMPHQEILNDEVSENNYEEPLNQNASSFIFFVFHFLCKISLLLPTLT